MRLFNRNNDEAPDGPNPLPKGPREPLGDRIIDRVTTSSYLLPIVLIGGAIWYFGFHLLYLAALGAGCIVWSYWGRKIQARDAKLALIVDVEKGVISPIVIGRRRWDKAEKKGTPYLSFRTSDGHMVEVLKDYDGDTNTAVYPVTGEYSDLYIASIPERYGDLIDELVKIRKENMTYATEKELLGLRKAQEHTAKLSEMFSEAITPRKKDE